MAPFLQEVCCTAQGRPAQRKQGPTGVAGRLTAHKLSSPVASSSQQVDPMAEQGLGEEASAP